MIYILGIYVMVALIPVKSVLLTYVPVRYYAVDICPDDEIPVLVTLVQ